MARAQGTSVELDLCRVLSLVVAVGALIEFVVLALLIQQGSWQADGVSAWREALTLGFLIGVAGTGLRAAWGSLGQLRIAAWIVAGGYLALIVVWSLGGGADAGASRIVVGLLAVPVPPVIASVMAWGPWGARSAFASATILLVATQISLGKLRPDVVVRDTHAVTVATLLCLLGSSLVAAARDLDRTRAAVITGAARHAGWLAHRAARTQMHAFLHDEVLATLTSATRATAEMRPLLARQAGHARRLLDELADAVEAGTTVAMRQFVGQIADLAARLDPDARLRVTEADADALIDGEVVGALLGAMHQALVNSLTHAGTGARRMIRLVGSDDSLTLEVIDDGVGFDSHRVSLSRMGLSVSILGRMRAVQGGSATVEAVPGTGTTVRLHWHREKPVETHEQSHSPPLWDGSPRACRLMCVVIASCQLCLGVVLACDGGPLWPSLATGVALGAAVVLVGVPGPGRLPRLCVVAVAAVVFALTVVVARGGAVGHLDRDAWCYNGCAVLLLLLCLRGRAVWALIVLLVWVLLNFVVLGTSGHSLGAVARLVSQPVTILGIGAPIVLVIGRLQRRTVETRAAELATSAAHAWNDRLRAELMRRSDDIRPLVVPLLDRIASGTRLDAQEIERCMLVEGRLRDTFRGGRLARPDLLEASEAARRRGLDVVLVDAAPDERLPERALDEIAAWIVVQLSTATEGAIVVRLNGRADAEPASVTTTGGTTTFGG